METANDPQVADRARAEALLTIAAELQGAFWDALSELEAALGSIEIDAGRDLTEATIDDLLDDGEEDL
jgi:hypothetical protein